MTNNTGLRRWKRRRRGEENHHTRSGGSRGRNLERPGGRVREGEGEGEGEKEKEKEKKQTSGRKTWIFLLFSKKTFFSSLSLILAIKMNL